jgi:hypothetical protein
MHGKFIGSFYQVFTVVSARFYQRQRRDQHHKLPPDRSIRNCAINYQSYV